MSRKWHGHGRDGSENLKHVDVELELESKSKEQKNYIKKVIKKVMKKVLKIEKTGRWAGRDASR